MRHASLGSVKSTLIVETEAFEASLKQRLGASKSPHSPEVTTMAVEKVNSSSSLAEVVDRILDKGIVIDAWVRISLVGIELIAIEARIVIASVETYLKYAEAVGLTSQAAVPAS